MKNHTENVVEKLFPDAFLENQNWVYRWIYSLKFYTVCFYCLSCWRLSKYIKTKLQITCFYLIQSFFKKQKVVWNQPSCLIHFPHDFWRKMFLLSYSVNWPNFIVWLLLFHEILGSMCIAELFVSQFVTS